MIELKEFTKYDYDMFAGVESDSPKLGWGAEVTDEDTGQKWACALILDGRTVQILHMADCLSESDEDAVWSQEFNDTHLAECNAEILCHRLGNPGGLPESSLKALGFRRVV